MSKKLVTIATFDYIGEAQIAKLTLASKGIDCFLADEFMGTYAPYAIGGIKLQVWDSDAERAEEVLREWEASASVEEKESAECEEE